jgi:hypothetical protein
MAVTYMSKLLQSKAYQNCDFWYENIPSGTPAGNHNGELINPAVHLHSGKTHDDGTKDISL